MPEKKKKRKKRKKRKTITVDVTDLFVKTKDTKMPKYMELWTTEKPMTDKCNKTINEMSTLVAYVAKTLNTYPEFKKSMAKRAVLLKCLVIVLTQNTFMDNFHRYGILHECMNEIHRQQHQPIAVVVSSKQGKPKSNDRKKKAYVT